jgi:hypothetical protein
MRVLGVLAAWTVLAVLATLCFAVGGSIGYRRGVQDAVRQLRERRSGKTGCRPQTLSHHRYRPITRTSLRSAADPLRARTRRLAFSAHGGSPRTRRFAGVQWSPAVIGAAVAVCVLAVPGVALGASTAQPGEALWGVKRGLEGVRLAMAPGADDEVEVHVDLAARRLSELNQLLGMGHADPQVVSAVIQGLHDHTEDAEKRLNDVEQEDRAALVAGLDDLVARQVAVIDLLIDADCTDSADQQCVALEDTRDVSAALQRTTSTIALAEDVPTGDPGLMTEPSDVAVSSTAGTAATEAATAMAASTEATASASEGTEAASTPSQPSDTSASPSDETSAAAEAAGDAEDDTATPSDQTSPTPSSATVDDPTADDTDSADSTTNEPAEQTDAGEGTPP